MIWTKCSCAWLVALIAACVTPSGFAQQPDADGKPRRVIVMWDTSQSMVKLLNRETVPHSTVWMARNDELEQVWSITQRLLFSGISNSQFDDRSFSQFWAPFLGDILDPLVEDDTVLSVYRFPFARGEAESASIHLRGNGPQTRESLESFLPEADRNDPLYSKLETYFARCILDAWEDSGPEIERNGFGETYLLVVSDNQFDAASPNSDLDPDQIERFAALQLELRDLCTLAVTCTPSEPGWRQSIIITLRAAGLPKPDAAYRLRVATPSDEIVLQEESDGRWMSNPVKLSWQGGLMEHYPADLPVLNVRLLNRDHEEVAVGYPEYPTGDMKLPVEAPFVFSSIPEDERVAHATVELLDHGAVVQVEPEYLLARRANESLSALRVSAADAGQAVSLQYIGEKLVSSALRFEGTGVLPVAEILQPGSVQAELLLGEENPSRRGGVILDPGQTALPASGRIEFDGARLQDAPEEATVILSSSALDDAVILPYELPVQMKIATGYTLNLVTSREWLSFKLANGALTLAHPLQLAAESAPPGYETPSPPTMNVVIEAKDGAMLGETTLNVEPNDEGYTGNFSLALAEDTPTPFLARFRPPPGTLWSFAPESTLLVPAGLPSWIKALLVFFAIIGAIAIVFGSVRQLFIARQNEVADVRLTVQPNNGPPMPPLQLRLKPGEVYTCSRGGNLLGGADFGGAVSPTGTKPAWHKNVDCDPVTITYERAALGAGSIVLEKAPDDAAGGLAAVAAGQGADQFGFGSAGSSAPSQSAQKKGPQKLARLTLRKHSESSTKVSLFAAGSQSPFSAGGAAVGDWTMTIAAKLGVATTTPPPAGGSFTPLGGDEFNKFKS